MKTEIASLIVRVDRLETETFRQFTALAREIHLLRHEFESFRSSVNMQLAAHDANFRDIAETLRELGTLHRESIRILDTRITTVERRLGVG